MSTKTYPVEVALSVASGKLLCGFPALHEAVTDLAGWPVFTHHMASADLMDAVAAKVIRQVRWAPGAIENMPSFQATDRADAKALVDQYLARIRAAHGEAVSLDLGEPVPYMSPFAGWPGEDR